MKATVSLTTKVMMVLLIMILSLCIAISSALIIQSNSNILRTHESTQQENLARLNLLSDLLVNRSLYLVESIYSFASDSTPDAKALSDALTTITPYMALNLNVNYVWVVSPMTPIDAKVNANLPTSARVAVDQTQQQFRPLTLIDCQQTCKQWITVPIMISERDTAVVILETSLRELLAVLSEASNARLSVVSLDAQNDTLQLVDQLSRNSQTFFNQVLESLPPDVELQKLMESGVQTSLSGKEWLVSLLPLENSINRSNYVIVVNDVSTLIASAKSYQRWVVGGAIILFTIFSFILYLLLNTYRHKMVSISERLPLLAQQKYEDFRERSVFAKPPAQKRFPDELDVLESTAGELADELEDLNKQVARNTAQLEQMALFDTLTGLPNRNMLTYKIEQHLGVGGPEDCLVAIMFIDLDDFKKVNDSYGHEVGDLLLKAAAQRISDAIDVDDIASRFGGDEFVLLLTGNDKDRFEVVANRLLENFTTPMKVTEMNFYISISVGISISQVTQTNAIDLLRHADIAMYEAKSTSGNAYQIYDATMNQRVLRKVELESEARIALKEDQFYLALQPQVDLKTGRLVGFEALLRWLHPEKGEVPPGEFIPTLENTPFMLQLDYWVIARALRLLKAININGYPDVKMAINLSAGQFMDPSLKDYLVSQIQQHAIAPHLIELELTETALVADMNRATSVMRDIQALGCQIAIDDFGTGYSSLSYLKSIPANLIKIDQTFVRGMLENRDDRNIVYSTISMVRNMGLHVIAEGIETEQQYELLSHFDCHYGQGYLISKPIKEDHLWHQLDRYVIDGAWAFAERISKSIENRVAN